jgi:methanogenic corrinoid protein MtbC1
MSSSGRPEGVHRLWESMEPSTDVPRNGSRIAQVSDALGIPVPTIRSWERRYGFPAPARTGGSHRRYSPGEVAALAEVRDRIARGERARAAIEAVRRGGRRSDAGTQLFAATADAMDQAGLEGLLRDAESRMGPERTIVDLALPGMRAIGVRWHAGTLDIASEHAATTAVRGWFAQLAGSVATPPGPPVVLACAPGERHTLGLDALAVLLGRRGVATLHLGADTPAASVLTAVRTAHARAAVVTAHRAVVRRAAIGVLADLDRQGVRAYYAGNAFATARSRAGAPGTYLGDDLLEAATTLSATVA